MNRPEKRRRLQLTVNVRDEASRRFTRRNGYDIRVRYPSFILRMSQQCPTPQQSNASGTHRREPYDHDSSSLRPNASSTRRQPASNRQARHARYPSEATRRRPGHPAGATPQTARAASEATPERSIQSYASEKNATPTFRKPVPRVHACTGRTGSIAKKRHTDPPSHRDTETHEPSGRARRKPRIDKQCMIAAVTACNSTTGAQAAPANIQQRHAPA